MSVDANVDVVIAGGGPAGLMLASELRLGGADPVLLERLSAPTGLSKALGLLGRAVQTLDYRGLLESFDARFVPVAAYSRFAHLGGIPLDVSQLIDATPAGQFPPPVPARQAQVEEVLEGRARELGAEIRRGHELVGLSQDKETVTAEVAGPDGSYRLRARYLVGCDGAHSLVRKQAGIGFPGSPPTHVLRLGDVTLAEADLDRLPPGIRRTPAGLVSATPLGEGVVRVVVSEWTQPPEHLDRDTPPTLHELQASVRRVLGTDLAMCRARWLSRFTDAARQADRYRAGRVLVAGDAAHIQLPAGGPGMSTALQDVVNLGWKLAAQVNGWAPAGLLDTYHTERHPVGERMLSFTRAQGLLLSPGEQVTALRELVSELLRNQPALRYVVDRLLSLDIRYEMAGDGVPAHPLAGGWAPDLPLRTGNGDTRLARLLHAARPVLLDLTADHRLQAAAAGWADRVQITAARSDEPLDGLLVRPDGYVAWAAAGGDRDTAGLFQALQTWFGVAQQHLGSDRRDRQRHRGGDQSVGH
jgi:2-polyprenyl-6-methoxyphenol hydroxylase-like FAD-dependent oxidoreductase